MIATVSAILGIIGFGVSTYKDVENLTPQLERAYNKALRKWARNDGVRESYAKRYYSSLSSLKEYIVDRRESVDGNTSELIKLFYKELKSYETAEGFEVKTKIEANIQISNEILANTREIIDNVKETKENVTFLVNHIKQGVEIQESSYILPHDYIERTARNYSDYSIEAYLHPEKYSSERLYNYIINGVKSIILFSDAQLGKTTELKVLAYRLQSSNLYLPYIFELCNYLSSRSFESQIERYLDLSRRNSVLILDGLDETNSAERAILVKEINLLRSNYSDLHIVISCRSNFKDLVNLTHFSTLYLGELGWAEVKRYIDNHCQDPTGLIETLEQNRYYEMTRSPFLLIETINYYENEGELPSNITAIYRRFIDRCFEVDKAKMPDVISPKARFYPMLKRIAFCLVVSQKMHITRDELYEYLKIPREDIELCIKLSIMSSNEDGLRFIHNSFKEFMTAESLSELSFKKLQNTICYEGSNKMRPSMHNTVILLLGVVDSSSQIYDPLKAWLISDYKELLINAGGEFLDDSQRDNIFQDVYIEHKDKGLWLEYNFDRSLMLFANTSENIIFLLNQISSTKEPAAYLHNALSLLHYADFTVLSLSEFSDARKLLLETLDKYKSDRNICDQTIKPIENITFINYDKEIIGEVFKIVKDTEYYNLIGMFCTITSNCDQCDEYADWVFKKSVYVKNYYEKGTTHIISNSYLVKFLIQLKKPKNIIKAIEYMLTTKAHLLSEEIRTATVFNNLKLYTKDKDAVFEQIINVVCAKDQYDLTAKYIDSYRAYIVDNYDLETLFVECYGDLKQLFTDNHNYTREQQNAIFVKFMLYVTSQGIDVIIADRDIDTPKKLYILDYMLSDSLITLNDAQSKTLDYLETYDLNRINRKRAEQDAFDLLFNTEELQKQVKEAISGYATIPIYPWRERAQFMQSCKNKTIQDFIDECVDGYRKKVETKSIMVHLGDVDFCRRFSLSHIPVRSSLIKTDAKISQEQRE